MNLIAKLLGFFTGGAGQAVSNIASIAALAAALGPLAYWFLGHKDEVAVSFSWGQLGIVALIFFALIEIVRATRPRDTGRFRVDEP
ncbi:MAG TPA: hypothetical protein VEM38_07615 [Burkholderiales bacterium]|nr:hypothetical protein [Burkholderiales bacterium]